MVPVGWRTTFSPLHLKPHTLEVREATSGRFPGRQPQTWSSNKEKPDPQTSNRWQLNNWLIKVNQPVSPTENFLEDDRSRGSLQEGKGQGKTCSGSSSKRECSQPTDGHSKTASKAPRSSQEVHLPTKRSYQKSPVHTEEPQFHQVVGSKQPRKSSKVAAPEEPKRGLTVESEPPGLYGAKDQTSKDKPKVKTKGRLKFGDKKELKLAVPEPAEKKKHKSLHQATVKLFSDRGAAKDSAAGSALELLPLSPLSQSPRVSATSRTSGTKPAVVVREDKDKFLLPIRDKKLLSPLRDCPVPPSLVVKIELALLSRVPHPPRKGGDCPKRLEVRESHSLKKQDAGQEETRGCAKQVCQKEKGERGRPVQISKPSVETQRQEMPLPPPLPPPPPPPPLSPAQKPAKMAQKRPKNESGACSQPPGLSISTAKSKESHKDSSSSKHRKLEGKPSESSKSSHVKFLASVQMIAQSIEPLLVDHRSSSLQQTDDIGKAFKYLDAALSLIECGIAMESDPLSPKPAYSMFAETIDLIKSDKAPSYAQCWLCFHSMRCQAILYMAMFRYKKDTAIKYSRTLIEHFKVENENVVGRILAGTWGWSIGTPSPLSPMPSPAGSVSSQTGSSASSCGSGSIGSSVNVPHFIPTITSSFVGITSYILYAYDFWEQADVLARKNKKFFSELSAAACPLSLNSSMIELVHYTRQGLQWLRLQPSTP
uniref:AF4/FMR2 C-terminal homology domain-containing protein n=1 Tax=Podarcis muralis TaxID=64176 RepID=A0A670K1Y0_PODMU